ncbi:MAG: hypothetical protein GY866_08205 [Proteobacteria bacterium]|nr:hypothetical protein [Pseudomonadota bacterium]
MNISYLIGMAGLFAVAAVGMTQGFTNLTGLRNFLHPQSLVLVLGGTLVSLIFAHSHKSLFRLPKVVAEVFRYKPNTMLNTLAAIVDMARMARRSILSIDPILSRIPNRYLRGGMQMVVDGVEYDTMVKTLTSELKNADKQRDANAQMVRFAADLTPAWGMIGTLFGLIILIKNLDGGLGGLSDAMSTALITTLYGALLSNAIFLPLYNRLMEINEEKTNLDEMIRDGVLSIANGERSEFVEKELLSFLDPELQERFEELKQIRDKRRKMKKKHSESGTRAAENMAA